MPAPRKPKSNKDQYGLPKVSRKSRRYVYLETDDMSSKTGGSKRATLVRSQPKRGYIDDTTITTKSGTRVTSRSGKITKVKVVDRSAAQKKATAKKPNPRPRTQKMR